MNNGLTNPIVLSLAASGTNIFAGTANGGVHIHTIMTGIHEETNDNCEFTVFPNPFSTSATVTINFKKHIKGNLILKIYNISGQLIKQIHITEYDFTLDRTGLNNGIYFCQFLENENILTTGKFIVE